MAPLFRVYMRNSCEYRGFDSQVVEDSILLRHDAKLRVVSSQHKDCNAFISQGLEFREKFLFVRIVGQGSLYVAMPVPQNDNTNTRQTHT